MAALHELTAHDALDRIRAGEITPDELTDAVRQRIQAVDPVIQAYVRTEEPTAETINEHTELPQPHHFPLPLTLKDNLCLRGVETTCCSRILKGFRPPYTATVVERFLYAGGVIVGQANMDEFAFGSSTENSCYGPTRNPWNRDRVPGGSSGGSAAAVAADEAIWALGSDTGGSIRQPAAFCGIVGLKPTYGRVSRYGLIAFGSSLDQIGPLTKDVTDAALMMNLLAGHDPRDSTSLDAAVPDYTQALIADVKELTIGLPEEYFIDGIDPEVRSAVEEAVALLKSRGAKTLRVSLPHTRYAIATYYITATAEASSNLARYDGVRYGLRAFPSSARKGKVTDMIEETREQGFGAEAKRRIMLGTFSLSSGYYDAYYLRGQKVRTLIKSDFDKAFEACDILITPTSPTTAFQLGEKAKDPLAMYLSDIFTSSANLAGIPAISIPCGFSKEGLPIGLQILAPHLQEEILFRVAYTYENQTDWHKQKPSITT